MKYILTAVIAILVYRFFIAPPTIDQDHRSRVADDDQQPQQKSSRDDEYIDYEEVD